MPYEVKKHIAQSGPKKGQWVNCTAKNNCRNQGLHVSEKEFYAASAYLADTGNKKANKDITLADVQGYEALSDADKGKYLFEATEVAKKAKGLAGTEADPFAHSTDEDYAEVAANLARRVNQDKAKKGRYLYALRVPKGNASHAITEKLMLISEFRTTIANLNLLNPKLGVELKFERDKEGTYSRTGFFGKKKEYTSNDWVEVSIVTHGPVSEREKVVINNAWKNMTESDNIVLS